MTLKIYTPNGLVFEGDHLSTLKGNNSLSSIADTLSFLLSHLNIELRKKLAAYVKIEEQTPTSLGWYFQNKYVGSELEVLIFRRNQDWQLHAFGLPEKALSLLYSTEHKSEILRLSGIWIRQGFEIWLIGSLDSHKPIIDLNPTHYQNKLYFEGLIGIG